MKKLKYLDGKGKEVKFWDGRCKKCRSDKVSKSGENLSEDGEEMTAIYHCNDCGVDFNIPYWFGPSTKVDDRKRKQLKTSTRI